MKQAKSEQPDEAPFLLEEATIGALHQAIRCGQTTLVNVIHSYIDRVRAYNGVASLLVTENGLQWLSKPQRDLWLV